MALLGCPHRCHTRSITGGRGIDAPPLPPRRPVAPPLMISPRFYMRADISRFALAVLVFAAPVLAAQRPLLLVPQPREATLDRTIVLARGVSIAVPADSEDAFAARELRRALQDAGVPIARDGGSARLQFLRANGAAAKALMDRTHTAFTPAMHDAGYLIVNSGSTISVIGATAPGVFYGAQTVKQLI